MYSLVTKSPPETPQRTLSLEKHWPNEKSNKPDLPTRAKWHTVKEWKWELFVWAISTCAFYTIFMLLIWFGGQPTSIWKSQVQFTAIIAALGQTAQTALLVPIASCIGQLKWLWFQKKPRQTFDLELFDMATRGPEGSFQLLFQGQGRRLASFGALATILMLSFQTFIQQSLSTEVRRISRDETVPKLSRAVSYFGGHGIFMGDANVRYNTSGWAAPSGGDAQGEYLEEIDYEMINAITSAQFDKGRSLSNVATPCPTKECSWPNHDTLAICTSFEDQTDRLYQFNKTNSAGVRTLTFTLPEIEAYIPIVDKPVETIDFYSLSLSYNNRRNRTTPNATLPGQFSDLTHIYLVYEDHCRNEGWKAWKATMRLCIQNINSAFNGTTNTTVVREQSDHRWYMADGSSNPTNITRCDSTRSKAWTGADYDYYCRRMCTDSIVGNDTFCIGNNWLEGIGWQIAKSFDTCAYVRHKSSPYFYDELAAGFVSDIQGSGLGRCNNASSIGLQGFKNRVNNFAISITNAMRTSGSSAIADVDGQAWETLTFVKVEFYWLALPVLLYVFTSVLLISTIIQSRKSGAPIWKHTALGLMRGLEGEHERRSRSSAKESARNTTMQLFNSNGFWKLKVVDDGTSGSAARSKQRRRFLMRPR